MAKKQRIDWIWSQDQIERSGMETDSWVALNELIERWNELDLTEEQARSVYQAFSELAQGHALLPEESEEVWVEAIRGSVHTGDTVRVLHNAFEGQLGEYHNGRVGRVTAVRSGQVFFRSTDDLTPHIDGAHYDFDKLQKRVA